MSSIRVHKTLTIELMNSINNKNTLLITSSLINPSLKDVQDIMESTKYGFELNINRIFRLLCKQMPMVGGDILKKLSYNILDILPKDSNETAIKNTYAKIHFWLHKYFLDVLILISKGEKYHIIFDKTPTKYELMCLYLLYELGCNIDVIDKENECAKFSEKYKDLEFIEATNCDEYNKKNVVCSSLDELYAVLIKDNTLWNASIVGYDNSGKLENFAYNFYTFLNENNKDFKIIDCELKVSESSFRINKALLGLYNKIELIDKALSFVNADENIKNIIKKYFYDYIGSDVTNSKIRNISFMIEWINSYCNTNILWLINCNNNDYKGFIKLINQLPIRVIQLVTDKGKDELVENPSMVLDGTKEKFSIPKHGVVTVGQTLAYEATQRVDELIYSGETVGLYRDNQFNRNKVVTLNTTMDEIFIYWDQDIIFRPHFKSDRNRVEIPVMFIQVTGWSDEYKDSLRKLLGDNVIWADADSQDYGYREIVHNSIIKGVQAGRTPIAIKNGEIDWELIKMSPEYSYRYLNRDTESLIFDKIQELISKEIVVNSRIKRDKLNDTILNILLNLDRQIINMIQSFDFTKKNPKMIITQESTNILSLEKAVIASFLHIVGFDIIIFVPTKYKGIEEYVDYNVIQHIELSNTDYNSPYKVALTSKSTSLLGKLFKK